MANIAIRVPNDIPRVPVYTVDLDVPYDKRWSHVLADYKDQFVQTIQAIDDLFKHDLGLPSLVEKAITSTMAGITHLGLVYYGAELKAIAAETGLPLGKLVLMQLVYEACAACTSIVVPNRDGVPLHIRTMDWEFEFLGPLTIELHFRKNGRLLYSATTWVGYVGILTGMRPGGYSVSVNFRNTGSSPLQNVKQAITRGWPIGFLLREVFESTGDARQAVEWLAGSSLIAPCYFTVCGTSQFADKGVLITRRRTNEEKRWTVREHGPIVQTNIDHWSNNPDENILYSIQRRRHAREFIDRGEVPLNEATLWNLMSHPPIFNEETVYATFMCPEIGALHSRLPRDVLGFLSDVPAEFMDAQMVKDMMEPTSVECSVCEQQFFKHSYRGGECHHGGTWHDTFSACNAACAYHLLKKGNVGKCHWSCCYNIVNDSFCKNSQHVVN